MSSRASYKPFFTPTQISGCQLWLDGADSSTFSFSSGNNVSQWRDKSGNGRNMAPPATINAPTFIGDRLLFDGVDDRLVTTVPISSLITAAQYTIFLYGNPINTSTSDSAGYRTTAFYGDSEGYMSLYVSAPNTVGVYNWNGGFQVTSQTYTFNTNGIFTAQHLSNTISLQVNGGTASTATSGNTDLLSGLFQLGRQWTREHLNCSIGEVMIFNRALTDLERQQVEGYLAWKWNLVSALPTNHPFKITQLYRNPVARVNRSIIPYYTAFSPLSIAGCQLWLDAADSTTVTGTTSVTSWLDKSGNNRTNTITSTLTRGTNSIVFPASGYLQNNFIDQVNIVFIVFQQDSTNNYGFLTAYTSGNGYTGFTPNYTPATSWYFNFNGNSWATGTGFALNQRHIVALEYTASTARLIQNGTILLNSGSAPTLTRDYWRLGARTAGEPFKGEIYEVVGFSGTLTTAQRQQVESYLAQKWGLRTSLPAGHIDRTQPAGLPALVPRVKTSMASVYIFPIVAVSNAIQGTDYSLTTNGGNYVYRFIATGKTMVFTISTQIAADILVVAGGGGGGTASGGGGGAGGLIYLEDLRIPAGTYSISIGTGGNGGAGGLQVTGTTGGNSSAFGYSSLGGGGGGRGEIAGRDGLSGGCGGGSGGQNGSGTGGTGTQPFLSSRSPAGTNGGNGVSSGAGGGGGMGGAGTQPQGGAGLAISITGTSTFYAAGGGGGSFSAAGSGGSGIGGNGGQGNYINGTSAVANTGSGGGGGGSGQGGGGNGGSGIVILRVRSRLLGGVTTTQSFYGTGSVQTFTVPAGVTAIRFFMWGAGGNNHDQAANPPGSYAGGSGAYTEGVLQTTPGTVYHIIVGRNGQSALASGGGSSGTYGGGGGGFSGIFSASPAFGNVIAIAGGGGGSGTNRAGLSGGGGGYPAGSAAPNATSPTLNGGGGGTQSAGGTGTATGGPLQGAAPPDAYKGGGGGGYYGGGAGDGLNPSTGGGGGSSYYSPAVLNAIVVNGNIGATNVSNTPAANEASPYWQAPYGRSAAAGLVVIGY